MIEEGGASAQSIWRRLFFVVLAFLAFSSLLVSLLLFPELMSYLQTNSDALRHRLEVAVAPVQSQDSSMLRRNGSEVQKQLDAEAKRLEEDLKVKLEEDSSRQMEGDIARLKPKRSRDRRSRGRRRRDRKRRGRRGRGRMSCKYPGAHVLEPGFAKKCPSYKFSLKDFRPKLDDAGDDFPGRGEKVGVIRPKREYRRYKPKGRKPLMKVAVVGDSHMVQWYPAILAMARRNDWDLTHYPASGCDIYDKKKGRPGCKGHLRKTFDKLIEHPPDVAFVLGTYSDIRAKHKHVEMLEHAFNPKHPLYMSTRGALAKKGVHLVAIRDTPRATPINLPNCIKDKGTKEFDGKCTAKFKDPQAAVWKNAVFPATTKIDMNKYICPNSIKKGANARCPAIIGNVLVYRDDHHLSVTFIESLSSILEKELRMLGGDTHLVWKN